MHIITEIILTKDNLLISKHKKGGVSCWSWNFSM